MLKSYVILVESFVKYETIQFSIKLLVIEVKRVFCTESHQRHPNYTRKQNTEGDNRS